MNAIVLALPGAEPLAAQLVTTLGQRVGCEAGGLLLHRFPDGETCPRVTGEVSGRDVVLVAELDQPDAKVLALYLSACVLQELGAGSIVSCDTVRHASNRIGMGAALADAAGRLLARKRG